MTVYSVITEHPRGHGKHGTYLIERQPAVRHALTTTHKLYCLATTVKLFTEVATQMHPAMVTAAKVQLLYMSIAIPTIHTRQLMRTAGSQGLQTSTAHMHSTHPNPRQQCRSPHHTPLWLHPCDS